MGVLEKPMLHNLLAGVLYEVVDHPRLGADIA